MLRLPRIPFFKSLVVVVCLFWTPCALIADDEPSIHISGQDTQSRDWTAAQLKEKFASEMKLIQYSSKGQKHISNCVPLLSILKASGVYTEVKTNPVSANSNSNTNTKPAEKNRPLHIAVWIQGRDGYSVVIALGEILPDFGNRAAWLALDVDGNALPDSEAPAKLILPEDLKPSRWVHGIAEIIVEDHAAATTQPSTR